MSKKHLAEYEVNSMIDKALSARVDSFVRDLVLPQVDAVLKAPATLAKIEKRVKTLVESELDETDSYGYQRGGIERLVDEQIYSLVSEAVHKELRRYLEISKSFGGRSPELEVKDRLEQIAKQRVAEKFKKLPAQLDAVIEEFMQLVATAKVPADQKRNLHRDLWGALMQVVMERFYNLLGKPAPESED